MATLKQKLVLKKMVGFGGNITKAMIAAGYSPATAHTPQKLTESNGWKELMRDYFPDEVLVMLTRELLFAHKIKPMPFPQDMTDQDIKHIFRDRHGYKVLGITRTIKSVVAYIRQPDNSIIIRTLDMIFRLKGYYKLAEQCQIYHNPNEDLTDEELDQKLEELRSSSGKERYDEAIRQKREKEKNQSLTSSPSL